MSNLKKYEEWQPEEAERALDESRAESDGKIGKLQQGNNVLRILPPGPGRTSPFRPVHKHFLSEIESSLKAKGIETKVIVCPRFEAKQPCPVCLLADVLAKKGTKQYEEIAKSIRAKASYPCNAVNRAHQNLGVKVFSLSKGVYEKLLALRGNKVGGGNFCDPGPRGFDVVIHKKGEKLSTEYDVIPARESSPLSDDAAIAEEWLDGMHDLDEEGKLPTADELEPLFQIARAANQTTAAPPPAQSTSSRARGGARPRARMDDDFVDDK